MPKPETVSYNPNSLWRNGSRSFFKDQRAHQIGDLLTVTVNITDQANFANETQRNHTGSEDSAITDFLGAKTLSAQAAEGAAGQPPDRERDVPISTARARSSARKA